MGSSSQTRQRRFSISGMGTLNFLTSTVTFVNNAAPLPGFEGPNGDLYDGPLNAAFATWNMLSSIGPIAGTANLLQWTNTPINTSGGVLVFNNGSSDTVFTATVGTTVPEPVSRVLFLTVLLGVAFVARKRFAGGKA